jgi:uncharacterized protein (TIGR03437 family)
VTYLAILFVVSGLLPAQVRPALAPTCIPTRLLVQLSEFGASVTVGGFPFPITVGVFDDCGTPRSDASVVAGFSDGSQPIVLQSQGNGQYSAVFVPQRSRSLTVIQITAVAPGGLAGNEIFTLLTAGLQLSQTGLIFQTRAGASPPAASPLTLTAIGLGVDFAATATTRSGGDWLHVSPAQGFASPSQALSVQVDPSGLAPGDYYGLIRVDSQAAANTPLFNTVVLNVTASGKGSVSHLDTSGHAHTRAADLPARPCGATLFPVITVATGGFSPVASWPAPILVDVVDAAKQPLSSNAIVVVSFSNGDPPLRLVSSADGLWSGTWIPGVSSSSVVITAQADFRDQEGCAMYSTDLSTQAPAPLVGAGGLLSAASFMAPYGISPGEAISIFGLNFSADTVSAPSLPLPPQLEDTQIQIAGRAAPLLFSSNQQVNAVLPLDIAPDNGYSAIAIRGAKISVPTPVTITHTNPAVYTINSAGTGQAHAYKSLSSGLLILADAAHPASPGDVLVVYATGLGAVDSAIAAGSAAPVDHLVKGTEVIGASIGGLDAPIAFAGLAPGFSGLYQVNLTVPAGVQRGNAVPLVLTGPNGHQSRAVTVAIE